MRTVQTRWKKIPAIERMNRQESKQDQQRKRKENLGRKKKQTSIVFAVLLAVYLLPGNLCLTKAEEELKLYARSAVLMDGSSGRILYGKETKEPLPMASTTKIMTCIVALEETKENMACTASEQAAHQPQVKLGMQTGETFYLKDLLYSLMLESHNDTAVCIAENVAGSVEDFAEKMNA